MKKIFMLLITLLFIYSLVDAQYKINKIKYDYRTYSYKAGDRYSPVIAGITSFLVPGLGQIISGETSRGLAFFGGFTGCIVITSIGLVRFIDIFGAGLSGDEPKRGDCL